jgi:hypothetical protein
MEFPAVDTASPSLCIFPREFTPRLARDDAPLVLDVRRDARFAESDRLGVLAVSVGMSALHGDDHTMLDAMMSVYDALHTWCVSAQGETHTWKPETMKAPHA